jgi:hypothetical protein
MKIRPVSKITKELQITDSPFEEASSEFATARQIKNRRTGRINSLKAPQSTEEDFLKICLGISRDDEELLELQQVNPLIDLDD